MANAMNDGHLEMCIQSRNGCNFVVICDFFLWHPEMMWQPKKTIVNFELFVVKWKTSELETKERVDY